MQGVGVGWWGGWSEECQDSVARVRHEERVRDEETLVVHLQALDEHHRGAVRAPEHGRHRKERPQQQPCLLYTSDAADEL